MRVSRLRRITQVLIGGVLANGWIPVAWTKAIYQGPLKSFCLPLLNCHGCPLAVFSCPIGALGHYVGIHVIPFFLLGFLALVGLLVGRMACGWICPFGLIQDLMYRIPSRKYHLPRLFRYGKYVSLFLIVGLITYLTGETWFCRLCPDGGLIAGLPWMLWSPQDPLTGAVIIGWSMAGSLYALKMTILCGFLVLFVLIKRPFCRGACPLGGFWAMFSRISLIKVRTGRVNSYDCQAGREVCPVDLKVCSDLPSPECINCFLCTQASEDHTEAAPCRAACPIHVDAQGYIALISAGRFEQAADLVREANPFPGITGRVCHHPCEDVCERAKLDEPVAICALKRAAVDHGSGKPWPGPKLAAPTGKKVGIVGSGPAGLLCAFDLARRGHDATVFEALPVVGGMLAVGIPSYRLPRDILNQELGVLERMGVQFRVSTAVGKDLPLATLLDAYDAVFLAPGCHVSRTLGIPGEDLEGVIGSVEFLRRFNLGEAVSVGRRVAVIGGGNAAFDAARTALRLGAESVTIVYRRSREEMPASEEEIEQAEDEGIEILYLASPIRVVGNGRVRRVECLRMELGEPDSSGRRRPIPLEGSEFGIDVDMLIPAISQAPDMRFLEAAQHPAVTEWGTLGVDPLTLQTSVEKVFAGGDAVTGPATYIDAMAAGRKGAESIHRYLAGRNLRAGREGEGPQTSRVEADLKGRTPKARIDLPSLSTEERRGTFNEVVRPLSAEDARAEADRCLACGGCAECGVHALVSLESGGSEQ
jgi:NADPH-dependent glutamate synthase beta subunit-like oxidoreductase/ferredoxin